VDSATDHLSNVSAEINRRIFQCKAVMRTLAKKDVDNFYIKAESVEYDNERKQDGFFSNNEHAS
jgi:hypothetical protein